MCSGCCRYIPDYKIKKIPLLGKILLKFGHAEKTNWLSQFFRWLCKEEIKQCEQDWEKQFEDEALTPTNNNA